jgi:hypothetical protein
MGKDVIWTDISLDGACSYLIFNWIKKSNIDVHSTSISNFRNNFEKWILSGESAKYDKIYILNMDMSQFMDLSDHPHMVIIDRHTSHLKCAKKYQHAKVILENSSSNSKLLLKLFSKSIKFTPQQLALVALVDDFENGCKKTKLSKELNTVYWGLVGKKPQKFAEEFSEGFNKFSLHHQNIISLQERKLHELIELMDVYVGTMKLNSNISYKVASTFSNNMNDDICTFIIEKYNIDIAIIVNTETQNVFFKRSNHCNLPMYKLAKTLCDGGGTEITAGGKITEKFMDFTKILNKI